MFAVSENYINKMDNAEVGGAIVYGSIVLPDGLKIELNEKNLKGGSLNISMKSCSGSKLEIGTAIKNQLSFSFYHSIENQYRLINSVVTLFYQLDEDIIPLGVYNVGATSRVSNCITLTCYDNMIKCDKSIGNVGTNGAPYGILNWIAKNCGIELAQTQKEIEAMTNGTNVVNVGIGVYSSYTDILKDVAGMMGGFATFNRYGKLEIRQYKTEPVRQLQVSQRIKTTICDYECYFTELHATVDSIKYVRGTGDGSGLIYNFNTKMINGIMSTVNKVLGNILSTISKIDFVPSTISIVSDPSFDLGDMVEIMPDGRTVKQNTKTLITSISWSFRNRSQIKSSGENPYLAGATSSSYSSSSSSEAIAKNNSTYVAVFENQAEYSIGEDKTSISLIEYTCGSNDICIISGQAEINVSSAGTLQIHYIQNGEENTFVPEQYLTTGKHIISFSCWFRNEDTNTLIPYEIQLNSADGLKGTVAADKVRSYVLGTTTSEGKFITDNVITETINTSKYINNVSVLGYEQEG